MAAKKIILLACPFDGGRAEIQPIGHRWSFVCCTSCRATSAQARSPALAAALWNKRCPPPPFVGHIEQAQQQVHEMLVKQAGGRK